MRRSVFGSLAGEGTFMHLPYVTVVPSRLLFKIILIYTLLIKLNEARQGRCGNFSYSLGLFDLVELLFFLKFSKLFFKLNF